MTAATPPLETVSREIDVYIDRLSERLHAINQSIHSHPELAYNEHHAHDTLCTFLEEQGFQVTRHAYGLETAFEVCKTVGSGAGRTVNFNLEYDSLPDMGHACGHNLIATAGLTGFLALAYVMERLGVDGTVHCLGTPAEEAGGGKIVLLEKGAFKDVDVSLMVHPMSDKAYANVPISNGKQIIGTAGTTSTARLSLTASYHGVPAHAGVSPWEGVNALDALVLTYNNISALRQQIRPDQRIHGCILDAPKAANIIPAHTEVQYMIRGASLGGVRQLEKRVRACIEAGGLATGCKVDIKTEENGYADLRINDALSSVFQESMSELYDVHLLHSEVGKLAASTDQGNVSYEVPALHALIGIPTVGGEGPHSKGFEAAAGRVEAEERFVVAGKGMAVTGWRVLVDDGVYGRVREGFEEDRKRRD